MVLAIEVRDVSKRFRLYHEQFTSLKERMLHGGRVPYEDFYALKHVSLDIEEGQTFGLLGHNGSGKSTLLKCIAGIIQPTEGEIITRGRVASLLELGAGFQPEMSGRDNIYLNASLLGMSKKYVESKFDEIVAFAELEPFIDNQVKYYSSGMYVRLGFAVAVHVDPEILIVDEVLAVGDEAFQRKCLDRIRAFQADGRTIVFVTHAVDLLREICNRAFFIKQGHLEAQGQPAEVIRAFRESLHGAAHLEALPQEERGTYDVRMAEVRIFGEEGTERQIFSPGESLEIDVVLQTQKPIDDAAIGFAFYDDRDAMVFSTNTVLEQMSLGVIDGKTRVRFKVPAIPLLSGRYHLTIGVHSEDNQTAYHWREKAWAIRIVSTGAELGFVDFNAKIEVEPL